MELKLNKTYEGGSVAEMTPEEALSRSVSTCMLWENETYESVKTKNRRIAELIPKCDPEFVCNLVLRVKHQMKLRHTPLFMIREMARHEQHKKYVATLLNQVITRPDDMTEFLSIYMGGRKQPITAQVKKGLAAAFHKFNAYQFAKYDRRGRDIVQLRDVMFLVHPEPQNQEQELLFKQISDHTLPTPDTWEVALSTGQDKKATWERLLREDKLGTTAFLRNLRNMSGVGVDSELIFNFFETKKFSSILPFQFLIAAIMAPEYSDILEKTMFKALKALPRLKGKSLFLVDVSGSMFSYISDNSFLSRFDTAACLAMLLKGVSDATEIYSFSDKIVKIEDHLAGFALRDAINSSQDHNKTYLGKAIEFANSMEYDRLIVLTDEQSQDPVPPPKNRGYMINIASAEYGVGYGEWRHIDGWSDAVVQYITYAEENEV